MKKKKEPTGAYPWYQDESTYVGGGIILAIVSFITFLILKLTSVITWSWLWVTSPIWGLVVIAILFLAWVGLQFANIKPFNP